MHVLVARCSVFCVGVAALVASITIGAAVPASVRGFLAAMSACSVLAFLPGDHTTDAAPGSVGSGPVSSGAGAGAGARQISRIGTSLFVGADPRGAPSRRTVVPVPVGTTVRSAPVASGRANATASTSTEGAKSDGPEQDCTVIADASAGIAIVDTGPLGRSIFRSMVAALGTTDAGAGSRTVVRVTGEPLDDPYWVPLQSLTGADIEPAPGRPPIRSATAIAVLHEKSHTGSRPLASVALIPSEARVNGASTVIRVSAASVTVDSPDLSVAIDPALAELQPAESLAAAHP